MAEFLFEIGLEEVPARMVAGAQAELERRVEDMLRRERLLFVEGTIKSFSTPRRLAVFVGGVEERQNPLMVETLGPSTKVAYRDGLPTPAAISFAKKVGVEVEKL
ncbi:MAG TPA: glycine--tRNA ligase subunit beta, partial [Edaphobacter sp.]